MITILIILIIIFFFLFIIKSNFENRKITFYDFSGVFDKELDDSLTAMFEKLFSYTNKKIEVYAVFGDTLNPKNDNTIRVQVSHESRFRDLSLFDINFVPSIDTTAVFTFGSYYFNSHPQYDKNVFLNKRTFNGNKNDFCLFAVSNGGCEARNTFFHKLSEYKKVDSCGKHLNNMGPCPGSSFNAPEFTDFIKKYKFMICFENKSQIHYLTEKLLNAYYYNTIPIYWGCPNIEEYGINMDAILYLKPEFTDDDVNNLIERIKYLDNNEEAYKRMYEQTFFVDGKIPETFDLDKIREKISQ